jgi:AP-2 complex subunit alpha
VDAEVQQRCVEYLTLCEKGPGMVDIMAEMPKFPERQVYCLIITIREFS